MGGYTRSGDSGILTDITEDNVFEEDSDTEY